MSNVEEIISKLSEMINSENPDYSQILALSNELAQSESNVVRFTVDAGIINRLGKELVSKGETAISELVKNAYDAEASYVNLIFQNAYSTGGTLLIEDDGLGMTRTELINGFMRLSSPDKLHNPISPNYKRVKAGKKGIGRFAAQRLGHRLIIITQTEVDEVAIKATIDWREYIAGNNLYEISNEIELVPKQRKRGTTLIIEDLYDSWSDAAIMRSYRYTDTLLQPEPLSKETIQRKQESSDPGFKASLYRDYIGPEYIIADENVAFYDHALAVIEGYVDENKYGHWRSTSSKIDIPTSEYRLIGKDRDLETPFEYIHDIYFKAYYFIYERSLIPGALFTYVKHLGNELGGIKLYRNGFRVPPYGERGNDWLGLDESVRRRNYIFPHQNQSFFGFVEIDNQASGLFEETSSREGLIENEAYIELTDFVYGAITTAGVEIASIRERKHTANQKDWQKSSGTKVDNAVKTITAILDQNTENHDNADMIDHLKAATEMLTEGIREEQENKQSLVDEINLLRVLAGLGLVIGEFVHEIKNFLPGFEAEIAYLTRLFESDAQNLNRINRLGTNLKSFSGYASYFDSSISRNVDRTLEPIDVKVIIHQFQETIQSNLNKSNIMLETNLEERLVLLQDLRTIPMHPSEWASILFNLYTNSKKAIKKHINCKQGKIRISCGKTSECIYVEFADNGVGVDPLIKDRIFEPFVTTSQAVKPGDGDINIFTGTGLGLKIIKDIVDSYNGLIYLKEVDNNNEYKTVFRIEIPKL